jgi:CTP synthase (UTP-ammonia lyase)
VAPECVLTVHDVSNIYHVPLLLEAQGAAAIIAKRLHLNLPINPPNLTQWRVRAVPRRARGDSCSGLADGRVVGWVERHAHGSGSRRHAHAGASQQPPNTPPHCPPPCPCPQSLAACVDDFTVEVRIALVGKYTGLQDSYLSVIKALQHASISAGRKLVVEWIDATALEPGA